MPIAGIVQCLETNANLPNRIDDLNTKWNNIEIKVEQLGPVFKEISRVNQVLVASRWYRDNRSLDRIKSIKMGKFRDVLLHLLSNGRAESLKIIKRSRHLLVRNN